MCRDLQLRQVPARNLTDGASRTEIDPAQLTMSLEGIDLRSLVRGAQLTRWWQRAATCCSRSPSTSALRLVAGDHVRTDGTGPPTLAEGL